jgi:hypothetical protein
MLTSWLIIIIIISHLFKTKMKNQSEIPDDLSDAINAIILDINREIINNTEGNEARNPNAGENASKLLDTSGNF